MTGLREAADAYEAYLRPRAEALDVFAIDGLDRLGVPVWNASAWGARVAHGAGYGATPDAARLGALGEAAEAMAAACWAEAVRPRELSVREAVAAGGVHPARLSLVAGTEIDDDARLLWVRAVTWPAGEPRLLPLEAAATNAAEFARVAGDRVPLFPPITNGLGAGGPGDRERAVRHGLLELLQRDLNWSQFKALDTGRVVDVATVAPELDELACGHGVQLRLAYSGAAFGVHGFHCSAIDRAAGTPPVIRTATGEGADPDPRTAARKAILEMCASRSRKQLSFGGAGALALLPEPYRERAARTARARTRELGWDLGAAFDALLGDPEALERVVGRITRRAEAIELPAGEGLDPAGELAAAGWETIVVDLTGPDDAAQVAKVVVPGLEAEVLSHHRLSDRGLRQLRGRLPDAVAPAGTSPGPGWRPVVATEPAWVDVAALEDLARAFVPLYREPDRHTYDAP